MTITQLLQKEEKRVDIQLFLDSQKTNLERNKLGQFATPTILANQVLNFGLSLLDKDTMIDFIDPAFGTGSFFSALLNNVSVDKINKAVGYEIDPHYGMPAKEMWGNTDLELRIADFTRANENISERFNFLICNPPYVRHHHLEQSEKQYLSMQAYRNAGIRMNGLSGLYCYFMAVAHDWLKPDAISGWLIPSEFMDVNYGLALKEYLLERVTLLRIHRFNPSDAQFDDALVSSSVVWFKNRTPLTNNLVEFSYGGSLQKPELVKHVSNHDLKSVNKWTQIPFCQGVKEEAEIKLGDVFSVKRGIATGNNKFFILTKEQVDNHDLPKEFLRPILPSPRYFETDEIFADKKGNPEISHELFLLDCPLSKDKIKKEYPKLWDYLEMGEGSVSEGYLCKSRKEWYFQENRPAAPILCTYMGRGGKGKKPFRIILNHSQATAANTYLLLYPKQEYEVVFNSENDLIRKIWILLNELPLSQFTGEGRVYGGGLYKLEPKELENVDITPLFKKLSFIKVPSKSEQMAFL